MLTPLACRGRSSNDAALERFIKNFSAQLNPFSASFYLLSVDWLATHPSNIGKKIRKSPLACTSIFSASILLPSLQLILTVSGSPCCTSPQSTNDSPSTCLNQCRGQSCATVCHRLQEFVWYSQFHCWKYLQINYASCIILRWSNTNDKFWKCPAKVQRSTETSAHGR